MSSKLFSGRMYKEGLRRSKITAFIFLAYILILQVVIPLITGLSNEHRGLVSSPSVIMVPLFVIPYLWVPIQTLVLFYAFDKRGSSDFYHSLPYTRRCLFISWMLSVLTVTVGGLLVGTLAGYMIRLPFPEEFILTTDQLGEALLLFFLVMLFALGCTLIAVSVTGTLLSNFACTLLLMFLPRLIMYTIRSVMLDNMPILVDGMYLEFFSLRYNRFVGFLPSLIREQNFISFLSEPGPIIYIFVLSVCYILIALWLFQRRKSETAGHSASGRIVKSVVLTAIGFTISLIGTYIMIVTESASIAIVFYVLAVVVFLIYELLTTRKWGNLLKAMPLLILVALLNIAVAGGISLAKNAIINKQLAAGDIRSVRIMEQPTPTYDYLSSINAQIEIEDPEVKEVVAFVFERETAALKANRSYSVQSEPFEKIVAISTKGGTDYYRLNFTEKEIQLIGKELGMSDSYKNQYLTLPEPRYDTMSLQLNNIYTVLESESPTQEQMQILLDTLQHEIYGMGFENWYTYVNTMNGYAVADEEPLAYVRYTEVSEKQLQVNVPVTLKKLPKTWNMLLEMICENQDNALLEQILTKSKYQYGLDVIVHLKNSTGQDEELYMDSGDSDKEATADLILKALRSSDKPGEKGFLIVSGWWTDTYYKEESGSWLLPVPDDFR